MQLVKDFVELKLKVQKLEEYTEFLAETLNKNIEYSEYLATQLHKVKNNFVEVSQDIKIPTFEEFIKSPSEIWKLYLDNETLNRMRDVYKDVEENQKKSDKKIRIFYEFVDKVYTEFIGLSRIDGYPVFKVVYTDYSPYTNTYNPIDDKKEIMVSYISPLNFNEIKRDPVQTLE
jgi:hypothetical protein